jgi:exosortase/archaeosortase family protein
MEPLGERTRGAMGLEKMAAIARRYRTWTVLFALVTTFAGVALIVDRPKGTILELFALPLVAIGGAVFAWAVWPVSRPPVQGKASLASRFLQRVTFDGRIIRFFPVIGIGMILADVAYNLMVSATPALQTEDTIVLLSAVAFLGYGLVPGRFARERDFILLFFIWINLILVVPLLLARLYYTDFEKSVDIYSWVALAPQTSAVLSLIGVPNTVHAVSGSTAPGLSFTPQHISVEVTIVISTACSGIYSFGIFAAAFIAFVLTESESFSRRIWLLLGLGLLAAYAANVLRMVVIVLIGFYADSAQTDLQNMLVAHSYAGWLIFLGWLVVFWSVLFKLLPREVPVPASKTARTANVRPELRCGICSNILTPIVPAARCACGAYYHRTCLVSTGHCPSCGEPPRFDGAAAHGST